MTDRALKRELLCKLGVTSQALSQRVQKLKRAQPMSTEDATYVIAQKTGIILDRFLDKGIVDRVRELWRQFHPPLPASEQNKRDRRSRNAGGPKERVVIIAGEFRETDSILPDHKLSEAKQMASVYPLLYVLENSVREVIDRVMTAKSGKDWWGKEAPRKLRDLVEGRMADDQRNSWHQRRGSRPVDYLDLNDLPNLMRKIQGVVVPGIIPTVEWFADLVNELYRSRCVLCHMNPLDNDNAQAVKLRFRQWQKQVRQKVALIPAR